jgi:hypothetical protein
MKVWVASPCFTAGVWGLHTELSSSTQLPILVRLSDIIWIVFRSTVTHTCLVRLILPPYLNLCILTLVLLSGSPCLTQPIIPVPPCRAFRMNPVGPSISRQFTIGLSPADDLVPILGGLHGLRALVVEQCMQVWVCLCVLLDGVRVFVGVFRNK